MEVEVLSLRPSPELQRACNYAIEGFLTKRLSSKDMLAGLEAVFSLAPYHHRTFLAHKAGREWGSHERFMVFISELRRVGVAECWY